MNREEMIGRATECRLLAEMAKQPEARETLLKTAETWEMLARQLQAIEMFAPRDAVIASAALAPDRYKTPRS